MAAAGNRRPGTTRHGSILGALAVLASGLAACSGPAPTAPPATAMTIPPPPVLPTEPPSLFPAVVPSYTEVGLASWYGRHFHKKPTASGEQYDMNDFTAAHRSLPLHTVVRVTNLTNNHTVLVRVNDRGPFAKGRVIDVSRGAAKTLAMTQAGVVPVRIDVFDTDQTETVAENQRLY
jgi:rare lipoprotein A